MNKKRKIRADRLILFILLVIALAVTLFFGIKAVIALFDDGEEGNNDPDPAVVTNSFSVEVMDYEVYEDKDGELGFSFVTADLQFKDDKAINYDLSNLMTDEGYKLNDIFVYEKKLNINSYDFSALKTVNEVISDKNELRCRVFVPYVKATDEVILTDLVSGASMKIDLNSNKADLSSLKIESTPNEIKSPDYDLEVSDNFISTMMTHQGEAYDCSMLSVYTFKLKVKSIKEGIRIDDATFVQSSTNESWEALDATYSSYKIENIIDKELKVNDEYALFFEVYSNIDDKPRYEGKITLSFSDGTKATIDATLN